MGTSRRPSRNDALLVALMTEVSRARTRVESGRLLRPHAGSAEEQTFRMQALASALADFADAASRVGVPLPYRFRDEIRLYEALYPHLPRRVPPGPSPRPRPGPVDLDQET